MRTDRVEDVCAYDWRRDGWLAACSLTAGLLIVSAFLRPGDGFDTFLRTFVCLMALVRGFAGFRRGGAWLPLSAAVIAILFNPARPIGMNGAARVWCDLIAAAWFAIVGAWQLLRSWDPQRGWAAAAVSLAALAVPGIAELGATNRDALRPSQLDENLAIENVQQNAAAAPFESETPSPPPMSTSPAATPPAPARNVTEPAVNAPSAETKRRLHPTAQEQSAETNTAPEPAASQSVATPSDDGANNEAGGQEVG
jgi:hypothetical protein